MRAERIIRAALWAYPRDVRRSRGDEMTATVLDLSEGSQWMLLQETLGLAYGGLSARAGMDPQASTRRLADICALAATIWGSVMLAIWLGFDRSIYEAHMFGGLATHAVIAQALLALSIGSALLNHKRLAGVSGLAWIGVFMENALRTRIEIDKQVLTWCLHWVAFVLVPLCGYVVMLLAPDDKRRRNPARLGWLAGVIALGIVVAPPGGLLGPGVRFEGVIMLAMPITGLLLLPASTGVPLGLALALAGFGLSFWTGEMISHGQQHEYLLLGITTIGPILLTALAATRVRFTAKQLAS
ncbi:MAG: hypothetical protein ACRDK2_10385 [Solirubrobacteraceae bacterium]